MSHELLFEKGSRGVYVKLSGPVTGSECFRINERIYGDESADRLEYQIWDFRGVERFEIRPEELHAVLLQDRNEETRNANQVIAFVAPETTVNALKGSYQNFRRWIGNRMESAAFGDLRSAREWVDSHRPQREQTG